MSTPHSADAVRVKQALADTIRKRMDAENISVSQLAQRLGTGRNVIRRILNKKSTSITLNTMSRATHALGLKIMIQFVPATWNQLEPMLDEYIEEKDPKHTQALEDEIVAQFYGKTILAPQPAKALRRKNLNSSPSATKRPPRYAKNPAQESARGNPASSASSM